MNQFIKTLVCFMMVIGLGGCRLSKNDEVGVRVKTKYGYIEGVEKNGILTYYGIPYGKVGNKVRWKNPESPKKWKEVLNCTKKEEVTLQTSTSVDKNGKTKVDVIGTDDALTLDVYTKKKNHNVPVLVYIHGGNNQSGSSFELNGSKMVNENEMVVVSINFRMGLLGFNCLPSLTKDGQTGNFTMMDIKKSFEWVKENIDQFGGNPNNITISGFSAGGRNIMASLLSNEYKGLYQQAIVFSGGMTIADETISAKKIAEIMSILVVEDGIKKDKKEAQEWLLKEDSEVKEYLNNISNERIVKLLGDAGIRMSKFPHLYNDDKLLPKDGFDATYVNDVPIMMVSGTTEFSLFTAFDSIYQQFENPELAKKFAIYYGSEFYRNFNTYLSAQKMGETYKSPIYLCEIQYGGSTSQNSILDVGSFHGVFFPMITDEHKYEKYHNFNNENYVAMGKTFREYLYSFINNGNPNRNKNELWKPWDKLSNNALLLDAKDGKVVCTNESTFKSTQQIIKEMMEDTTIHENDKKYIIKNIINGRWFSDDVDQYFHNDCLW